MRNGLIVLWMLLFSVAPATAQVGVGIGLPGVSIGINLPLYPELEPVPGYPVYYAPRMNSNYFFYDGMYWVFQGDSWYASSWYNGPWMRVDPEDVPLYILRVPVRYYRHPPGYFHGWRFSAPPRWGEHWGNEWAQRRSGWDRWNRNAAPAPAPLPFYQRKYSGDRYPQAAQQQALQSKNYRYQPHDPVVRQHYQAQQVQSAPAPAAVQRATPGVQQERHPGPQGSQRSNPPPSIQQSAPAVPHAQPLQRGSENVQRSAPPPAPPQRGGENVQRSAPPQAPPQRKAPPVQQPSPQPQHEAVQHQQPESKAHSQGTAPPGKAAPQQAERGKGPGQQKDHENAGERGQDQKK